VPKDNLGSDVGVVLLGDYRILDLVLPALSYDGQLIRLLVRHFLVLFDVLVAEPAVGGCVGGERHLFGIDLTVLGAAYSK
jgi:hypothetical protein